MCVHTAEHTCPAFSFLLPFIKSPFFDTHTELLSPFNPLRVCVCVADGGIMTLISNRRLLLQFFLLFIFSLFSSEFSVNYHPFCLASTPQNTLIFPSLHILIILPLIFTPFLLLFPFYSCVIPIFAPPHTPVAQHFTSTAIFHAWTLSLISSQFRPSLLHIFLY